jgi:hypothetical protein
VLGVCLRLTCGGSKPLHFDGRTLGAHFCPAVCHQRIYRITKSLVAKGWLIKQSGGFRAHAKNGLYAHTVYTVLDHEQWALKHKGGCRTVITTGHGEQNPPSSPQDHRPSSPRDHSSCIRTSVLPFPAKSLQESSHKVLSVRQETVKDVLPTVITTGHGSTAIDSPDGINPQKWEQWKETLKQ